MQQIKMMVRQEMGQMMGTLLNGRAAASTPVWELPDAVSAFCIRRMSRCKRTEGNNPQTYAYNICA
jgi:hypothetical protein